MPKAYKSFFIVSKPENSTNAGWSYVTKEGKAYGREISFPISSIGGDEELHDILSDCARRIIDVDACIYTTTIPLKGNVYRIHKVPDDFEW